MLRTCGECGKEILRYKYGNKQVFCDKVCHQNFRRRSGTIKVTCTICGVSFDTWKSQGNKRLTCGKAECVAVVKQRVIKQMNNGRRANKRAPRIPDCHPDQVHVAFGLCPACYRERDREKMKERSRRWRKADPERAKAVYRKHRYGVSADFFDTQFNKQGGLCAVCKLKPATDIDHSHLTEKVRGLLCGSCNRGLGLFGENTNILQSAMNYLHEWGK